MSTKAAFYKVGAFADERYGGDTSKLVWAGNVERQQLREGEVFSKAIVIPPRNRADAMTELEAQERIKRVRENRDMVAKYTVH